MLKCSLAACGFRVPAPEVAEPHLASLTSSGCLFHSIVKEQFLADEADISLWVETCGPGRASKWDNVCKALGVPWKKIQGIFLITAGLPVPLNSENPFK